MGGYSVCKLDIKTHTYNRIFDGIDNIEDAELLAQLAMRRQYQDGLIFIFPGWNRGIEKNEQGYKKALKLAEEHELEDKHVQKSQSTYTKKDIIKLLDEIKIKLDSI